MDQATTDKIKAGTLANLHDLWLWDVAERQRLQRAAEAGGYGFDTREYSRPFPGTSVVQVGAASATPAGASRLGPALVAGAALLGGLGLGGGAAVAALSALHGAGAAGKGTPTVTAAAEPQEYEVTFETAGKLIKVERP